MISPLETPQPPGEYGFVPGAAAYAEAFQVSEEEAARRLVLQVDMAALVDVIAENEPQYAAAWFVHEPEFGLVISFTTPNGEVKLRPYLSDPAWSQWAEIVHAAQSPLSHGELVSIQQQLYHVERKTDISFESGVSFPSGKLHLYTPQPDALEAYLQSLPSLRNRLEHIEVIYQESLTEPASTSQRPLSAPPAATPQPYSPQQYGGVTLNSCTAGFVFRSEQSGKRYISTAGHCGDIQGSEARSHSAVIDQGVYSYDVQWHDVFKARGAGITNQAKLGSYSASVVGYRTRQNLYAEWVCKSGKVTHQTCGTVTNTNYRPTSTHDNTFVKAERHNNNLYMVCRGDSGAPVYLGYAWFNVIAAGILYGGGPSISPCSTTNATYFVFADLGNIYEKAGSGNEYKVLTVDYAPRFYQNVFAPNGSCTQYKGDVRPDGSFANWSQASCDTSAPGSGTVTSYTNYVIGDYLHEAMWRDGKGYIRSIPINNDGTVNWNAAPSWSQCCSGLNVAGQGAFVAGDYFYQLVWNANGSCSEYHSPLDDNGNFTSWSGPNSCPTSAPGSGNVTSYTNYIINDKLHEAMWRGGNGYIRTTPIGSDGTVDWNSSSSWGNPCCSGQSVAGQGAYILWHR